MDWKFYQSQMCWESVCWKEGSWEALKWGPGRILVMLCLFFVGEAGTDRNFGFSMALFPLLRPLLFSVYVIFSSFRVPHSLFSRIRTDVGASFPRLPLHFCYSWWRSFCRSSCSSSFWWLFCSSWGFFLTFFRWLFFHTFDPGWWAGVATFALLAIFVHPPGSFTTLEFVFLIVLYLRLHFRLLPRGYFREIPRGSTSLAERSSPFYNYIYETSPTHQHIRNFH